MRAHLQEQEVGQERPLEGRRESGEEPGTSPERGIKHAGFDQEKHFLINRRLLNVTLKRRYAARGPSDRPWISLGERGCNPQCMVMHAGTETERQHSCALIRQTDRQTDRFFIWFQGHMPRQ